MITDRASRELAIDSRQRAISKYFSSPGLAYLARERDRSKKLARVRRARHGCCDFFLFYKLNQVGNIGPRLVGPQFPVHVGQF